MHAYRTHTCGELTKSDVGATVKLSGWLHRRRDHGGVMFIDLRDHYGLTQCVFNPGTPDFETVEYLRAESVITIEGRVVAREDSLVNPNLATGSIEVVVDKAEVLSRADELPLPVFGEPDYPEDIRLRHRYLDLRRETLHANMKLRSDVITSLRRRMVDQGFTEYQTPILTASSPEGARDFLVPSRLHPGEFYALPQAPQQFKQLLMVSGFDRYFQIAPCFRDEDARADRSPGEFYQLDIEMSFVEQEDVFNAIEPVMRGVFEEFAGGKAEGYELTLGSGTFIPGFEEQLIGVKVGDKIEVKVKFPDSYGAAELSGKDAVFDVTVNELKETVPSAIDDELAKKVGMENLEALKKSIREEQESKFNEMSRMILKRALLDELSAAHDFEIPEKLLDREFDTIWKQFEEQRKKDKDAGQGSEEKTDDEHKKDFREIAERRVRLGLLLSEVGRANNVQISQEDVNSQLMAEARRHPGREKEVMEHYKNNPKAMEELSAPLYEEKVVNFILEQASITEKTATKDELIKTMEDEAAGKPKAKAKAGGKSKAKGKAAEKKAAKKDK